MHGVLPPYRIVEGPGQAMLPRTPQNRTRIGDFNIHVARKPHRRFYWEWIAMSSRRRRTRNKLRLITFARFDQLVGGRDSGDPPAVGCRKITLRAGFAGEKQAVVHRCCEDSAARSLAGQCIRIRTARERVRAPTVNMDRLYPARELAAEQRRQFRHCKIEKGGLAFSFEFSRVGAAEINFNLWASERAQMISRGTDPVGRAK